MNCPTDATVLQLAERHGIEIDYCPTCRGVWLDRGELDKIIDRADTVTAPASDASRGDQRRGRGYDDDFDDRDDRRTEAGGHKRKRGGFLGELFELGG
jgi:Zn-finger nucleic acid-binding protein